MKKCPHCGQMNPDDRIFCAACDRDFYVPKPKKQRKPRKPVEYVRLYHGPLIKKSTANWLAKKEKEQMTWVWFIIIILVIVGIVSHK